MKRVHVATRAEWRRWLAEHHDREPGGIWLVFHRKQAGRSTLAYEESVEEALCFGWIDSLIKRIDADTYCRKFTPRKDDSAWSSLNRKRTEKVIREGRMTRFGRAKVEAAKRSGRWDADARPAFAGDVPPELARALARSRRARDFFEGLAPSYRRQFIGWIATARRPETRANRVRESVALLARGRRLGLR